MNALRRGADPFYFFLVIDYNYNPIKMFGGRKTYRKGRKVRRGGFAENYVKPFGGRKTCRRKIRRGGFLENHDEPFGGRKTYRKGRKIRRGGLKGFGGQCGVNDPYCNLVD